MLSLICEKCGSGYEKPDDYKKWNEESPNVFFKWSLRFCDTCRRARQNEALKSLPQVLIALTIKQDEIYKTKEEKK